MANLTDTVKSLYAAFAQGNIAAIRGMMTEDVSWEYEAPSALATSGIWRSPSGVAEFFSAVASQSSDLNLQMTEFLATGDTVAAFGRYQATVKATGIRIDSPLAQYFQFRDGKIARFVQLSNTGAMLEAIHAPAASSADENKKLITEYLHALSGKEKTPDIVAKYVADEVLAKHIALNDAAFPNYEFLPEEMISQGDLVAVRAKIQGVHLGAFAGIEPTGKSVSVGLIIIYRVQNRKVVDHWLQFDMLSLLQQLSHPLEQIVRDAYAAFGRGDIDGYMQPATADFTFVVPGSGGISGVWAGKQGLLDLAGKAMALSAGTFHEEVEDVLTNSRHAVVLARHRFTREGSPKDYQTAHVYEVRDGKLARCFEQARDPAAFHDAWGSALADQPNVALVVRQLEAFGRRDIDTLVDNCTVDCEINTPGPEIIPYAGMMKGHAQIRTYFDKLIGTQSNVSLNVDQFVAQGNTVVVIGRYLAQVNSTGKTINTPATLTFEIRETKSPDTSL